MRFAKIIFAALVLLCFCVPGAQAENRQPAHPLRVAYIEGGPYTDYQKILLGLVQGLAQLGAITNGDVPSPEDEESTAEIWKWLCANAGGKFFEFVPDAYYSSGWDDATFAEDRQVRKERHCQLAHGGDGLAFIGLADQPGKSDPQNADGNAHGHLIAKRDQHDEAEDRGQRRRRQPATQQGKPV